MVKNIESEENQIKNQISKEEWMEGQIPTMTKPEKSLEKEKELTKEKYEIWQNAKNEEEKIEQEIGKVLKATGDKEQDESASVEKYGDLYKARKKSQTALREYIVAREKSDSKPYIYHLGGREMMEEALKRSEELFGE